MVANQIRRVSTRALYILSNVSKHLKIKMAAGKEFWNSDRTEQFIALWESKPCLYDTTKEEYHNRNAKKKAKEEIAKALGITGESASLIKTISFACAGCTH